MLTPGIYIKEKLARPVTLAGASTAVPVFIGYTGTAAAAPVRITGMLDFHTHFGAGYQPSFSVEMDPSDQAVTVVPDLRYHLYDTLQLYFRNGGGPCWVISTGLYGDTADVRQKFEAALAELDDLDEVSLVLVPDLHASFRNQSGQEEALLSAPERLSLRSGLLNRLGQLQDKFALFELEATSGDPFADAQGFRDAVAPTLPDDLKYGAAYYPWLRLADRPVVGLERMSLSQSYAGHPLVDLADQAHADVLAIEAEYGFAPDAGRCRAEFESMKAAFEAAAGSSKKARFTDIFRYLYTLVAGLDHLEAATGSLASEFAALKANGNLIRAVQHLYRIKGILDAHTNPVFLSTTGFNYPADPAWFNTSGSNYPAGADVETDAALLADYDNLVNGPNTTYTGWAAGDQVLADLASGQWLEMDLLFGAVGSLYAAALHRSRMAGQQLVQGHPAYASAVAAVEEYLRRVPCQGAVAGAYCVNDRKFGVWRSPANLALEGVSGPVTALSNAQQDSLNVDAASGKSINVIRTFTGKGVLIWGARTLAGNSNEWRYIAVRRFFSYAEDAIRKAAAGFMFAPNHARTWVQVKAVISGFLLEQWNNGALAGSTWEEAFEVTVGQGNQPGEMEVQVGMAVARPAEFITVSFSQSMQNA